MKVKVWATEKEFPLLEKGPCKCRSIPRAGRGVTVWPSYPHWKPKDELNDKILILERHQGDRTTADKCTVFADHLNCPTGFEFYNGGVIVADAPSLLLASKTAPAATMPTRAHRVIDGIDSADRPHREQLYA